MKKHRLRLKADEIMLLGFIPRMSGDNRFYLSKQDKRRLANFRAGKLKSNYQPKVLIYDIETSLVEARLWSSGKQYVGHNSITTETQIITVAYKWLGENDVHYLTWNNKKKSDKKLIKKFAKVYNQADLLIGFNNDRFDDKIVHARAMKYGIEINTYKKSLDLMKQLKKHFRLASYSLAYISKYLGLSGKLDYAVGRRMWEEIQWGTKKDSEDMLKLMVKYNLQDVILTEEVYKHLLPYLDHKIHLGALQGKEKHTCPNCGGNEIKLHKTIVTPAGTIQRVVKCKSCKAKYKISNTNFLNSL